MDTNAPLRSLVPVHDPPPLPETWFPRVAYQFAGSQSSRVTSSSGFGRPARPRGRRRRGPPPSSSRPGAGVRRGCVRPPPLAARGRYPRLRRGRLARSSSAAAGEVGQNLLRAAQPAEEVARLFEKHALVPRPNTDAPSANQDEERGTERHGDSKDGGRSRPRPHHRSPGFARFEGWPITEPFNALHHARVPPCLRQPCVAGLLSRSTATITNAPK